MAACLRNIKLELSQIRVDFLPLIHAEPYDDANLCHWKASIMGPPESPYKGAVFYLDVNFPNDYPFKPPKIKFLSKIFHPNIGEDGEICASILGAEHSPALTLRTVLISISSMLTDPLVEADEHPYLNLEAAKLYADDRERYNELAKASCENFFDLSENQYKHFYDIFGNLGKIEKMKLLVFNPAFFTEEESLGFPNDSLEKNFIFYEKNAFSHLPDHQARSYRKSKLCYHKIRAVENKGEEEKWYEAMMEFGDIQFVEDNLEDRIRKDLMNATLWKLYFEFLLRNNKKKFAKLYSEDCRYFPNEFKKIREYLKGKYALKKDHVETAPIDCYFNPENTAIQNFAFQNSTMYYITNTVSPNALHSLHKSAKYFYNQIPTPVCYKLEIRQNPSQPNSVEFKEQSLIVNNQIPPNSRFLNIHISTVISVDVNNSFNLQMLSSIVPRIEKCDAKYISIRNQKLIIEEAEKLIGNVADLFFDNVNITSHDGSDLMLEDLLKLTPKIVYCSIKNNVIRINQQTAKHLSELPFKNKIKTFDLRGVQSDLLDPNDYVEFICKNSESTSWFYIRFLEFNRAYIENFNQVIKNAIDQHWTENEKPTFGVFYN